MLPLKSFLKSVSFWFFVFLIQAVGFLLFNLEGFEGKTQDIFLGVYKALYMNLATAVVLATIPLLLLFTVQFIPKKEKLFHAINNGYHYILLAPVCFVSISDIALFQVWGTKINAQALGYLQYPKDVLPMIFSLDILKVLVIGVVEYLLFLWMYRKFKMSIVPSKTAIALWKTAIFFVVLLGLNLVVVRGGFGRVVLNRNWVFHSSHTLMNYTALNSTWNFLDLVMQPSAEDKNPYAFFSETEAAEKVLEMHLASKDTTVKILTTTRPNVVLILVESLAGDVVECIGGEKGVAKGFTALASEGILFDRFYSTGYRTDQGLLAALSAIPAQPSGSVMHRFGKFDRLPNLFQEFKKQQYHTSYFFGGRLSFDNVESYLRASGIDRIVGEDQMPIVKRTAWGAYDEEMLDFYNKELKEIKAPFFSVLATLTTHEWFDAKVPKIYSGDPDPVNDAYRNTVHYTDSCLYDFFSKAKNQTWYSNTLFIVMSDHSCKFPKHHENHAEKRHHIPMLMLGGALKEEMRGKVISTVGSHLDIAATLFGQMELKSAAFPWSKNLFNPYHGHFAYYAFDNGFGLIYPDFQAVYDNNQNRLISNRGDLPQTHRNQRIDQGKALMQHNYRQNMMYSKPAAAGVK